METKEQKIGRYPVDETFVGDRDLVVYFPKSDKGWFLLAQLLLKNYNKN